MITQGERSHEEYGHLAACHQAVGQYRAGRAATARNAFAGKLLDESGEGMVHRHVGEHPGGDRGLIARTVLGPQQEDRRSVVSGKTAVRSHLLGGEPGRAGPGRGAGGIGARLELACTFALPTQ